MTNLDDRIEEISTMGANRMKREVKALIIEAQRGAIERIEPDE